MPLPEDPDDEMLPDGSPAEYLMLRLRLREGVTETGFRARFGASLPKAWRQRARALPPALVVQDDAGIRLTRQGFLVSNAIIAHLLDE